MGVYGVGFESCWKLERRLKLTTPEEMAAAAEEAASTSEEETDPAEEAELFKRPLTLIDYMNLRDGLVEIVEEDEEGGLSSGREPRTLGGGTLYIQA